MRRVVYVLGRRVKVVSGGMFSLYFIFDSARPVGVATSLRDAIRQADNHYRKVM